MSAKKHNSQKPLKTSKNCPVLRASEKFRALPPTECDSGLFGQPLESIGLADYEPFVCAFVRACVQIEELNTKNSSLNEDLDLQKHSTKMLVERLDDRESKIQDLENQNKCLERIRKDIVNAMGLREPNKSASEQAPPASQMHTPLRH